MSGHSKWANIKHKKEKTDAQKGKVFTKIGREISICVRQGGPAVVGHYHSHPTGVARPSARDAADAAPDKSIWLIVAGKDVTAWRAVPDGSVEGRFTPLALHLTA